MKKRLTLLATLYVAAFSTVNAATDVELDYEPYPLEYWALDAVISNVDISPDGKYLALKKVPHKKADPIIEVYDASDLSKEPFRMNADPMQIQAFYWVSDTKFVFIARQQVREVIEGYNQGVFESRIAMVDVEKKEIKKFDVANPSIENLLVNDPDKIIISMQEGVDEDGQLKVGEAFRPRSYWLFDLERGSKQLLIRGKLGLGNIDFDGDGNPWLARGFQRQTGDSVTYYRPEGGKGWEEIYRQDEDDPEIFTVIAKDDAKPGNVLVVANNGDDKEGLWSMNTKTKEFEELIYRRSDVDLWTTRRHSNSWKFPDRVVGISYAKDKVRWEYFDEIEGAIYAQLEQIIPNAYNVSITSRSRDDSAMTIYNVGPRDPGTYYLLREGQIKTVGSRQPLLEAEKLADVEYIVYPSRDGGTIPGYLTIPNGKPPFPLVVMPHGGPFVAEVPSYDPWAQMFANNGYLVLQPQYRGSRNYGLDFYHSSFADGGQIGYKMQDDKDDGALYLVERGLADPDRMAMYGGSYGGYASLVAASRTPQIYQCVIASAVVSDPVVQMNYLRNNFADGWENEQFINTWDNAVRPVKEAPKVNVPMLIIHGSVDQRTPPEQAKIYLEALDKANKNYKYIELDGADHFFDTWSYDHKQLKYSAMLDFLSNDCQLGGYTASNTP